MVAGARGDFWLGGEGAEDVGGAGGIRGGGEAGGVDDDGVDAEGFADLCGMDADGVEGIVLEGDAEDDADLAGFLEVEPEDDVEVFLESCDELEQGGDVLGGALGRVCEVEEEPAFEPLQAGGDAGKDLLEDLAHEGEHGPVDKGNEGGVGENAGEFVLGDVAAEVGPVDLLKALVFAAHDFAVVEFDGVGEAGVADGMEGGAFGEIGKDGVDGGGAQAADISNGGTVGAEGVCHDGAVAAEFDHLGDELEICTESGGGFDASCESPHLCEAGEFGRGFPFVDNVEDGVQEAVESNKDVRLLDAGAGSGELFQNLTWEGSAH